jgi:triosephosphate isomerase
MSMRKPIVAANWKMQKTAGESVAFVEVFLPLVADVEDVEIVIAPPFTALDRVGRALDGSAVELAAQNVNAEEAGAFTGEIAPRMLEDLRCSYTVVGHSERRSLYDETSEVVAAKAAALLRHAIRPIVCVGETLEIREQNRTFEVVGAQLTDSLAQVPDDKAREIVIAYEPVWAIGTGRTATPEMAQEVHAFIREQLGQRFGDAAADIRIQYGGSVKPDNAKALMGETDIDGALVGGAGLEPDSFANIVKFDRKENSG